jgi:hypothetical protein
MFHVEHIKLSEKLKRTYTYGDFSKKDLIMSALALESAIGYFEECENKYTEHKGDLTNE